MPSTVAELRRHAGAFAAATGGSDEFVHAVALAVSETVTNAVVHAYARTDPGTVSMRCRIDDGRLVVEVADEGGGISARTDSPGVGQGLAVVGALVQSLEIEARAGGPGTVVTMSFTLAAEEPPEVAGLEPLCALALERIADVSCIDLVSGGVLRRAAAEVAGDAGLTEWLRGAIPPAKPGTATWDALREGGVRLVVHDPSVPRSPGGTGERLGLAWWVSVMLNGGGAQPVALWGLGGREGGRPVPSDEAIGELGRAAGRDLTRADERDALRARLGA